VKHQYRYHPLFSALIAAGLCGMSGMAFATGVTAPTTSSSISVGEVSSTTGALDTLAHLPTKKQVFNSTQSVKVINKRQMATAGPAGGAAQALAVAPGINVVTNGPSGAPRSSISINGMKTGWGNIAGNANDGTVIKKQINNAHQDRETLQAMRTMVRSWSPSTACPWLIRLTASGRVQSCRRCP